jgi:hypothetical protein
MVTTVGEFASIYQRDMATTFKPSYARATLSLSKIYIVPSLGKYKLEEVTGRAPQLMINFMRDKNLSRKTIKNGMTLHSAMVCTAKSWGYVATKLDWDTLFVPVEDVEKEVRCFTLDEAHRIIDATLVRQSSWYGRIQRSSRKVAVAICPYPRSDRPVAGVSEELGAQ